MDLRQLKYFVAVAEQQNFGRAAARLHISQPPITRQIKLLERELGVMLFERTHWGVRLTPAGEEVLSSAKQIGELMNHAVERARRVGMGQAGRLHIGVFGSGALSVVPAILRRYLQSHPDVEMVLLNVPQAAQLEALRQRRILITFDRYLPRDPDLTVEVVVQESLLLAVAETHPLARRSVISVRKLEGEPMVMPRDSRHADWVTDICHAHGFAPMAAQHAGDMVAGLPMVANGFGVQIVPRSMQAVKLAGVVYRRLRSDEPRYSSMDLQCAYRRTETSPLLPPLLEVVREYRAE
jgi:DNA-binding transcriptional LysR family regulator